MRDEEDDEFAERWEWWREKEDRAFSCSLPPGLMEYVRRQSRTKAGTSCRFAKQGSALACAAWCAGEMIQTNGSIQ